MTEQQQTEAVATYGAAVTAYLTPLTRIDIAKAVAPTLDCEEVTGIARLLKKTGHHEAADWWLFMHSTQGNIDEFDEHADYWKEADPWL
ncbi:hypothetical protein NB037_01750 [Rathayibacter sp. ZW T2_19]|uniref:Uncharacterized protein n=1 Tax=Rathayibacter rubneri TaxID=2950106 RepID=A0A9X2DXL2_9MICO|nr:hypothetical protein [Rathayibacter rubneri]MCM6761131.1 hypothetical protein [Rathayibacter rubneri]